jgi:hypothetical protein
MLYNIIWAGLKGNLLPKLKPFTKGTRKINTIEKLCDQAANVETESEKSDIICKMTFGYWEPPGVSERTWSINLEASVSGENQTLGGHSG